MSAGNTWYADFQTRQREMSAAADLLVAEMRDAGYSVRLTDGNNTHKVRVSRSDSVVRYAQTSSATMGRYVAVKAAHDKWLKHRAAVQP